MDALNLTCSHGSPTCYGTYNSWWNGDTMSPRNKHRFWIMPPATTSSVTGRHMNLGETKKHVFCFEKALGGREVHLTACHSWRIQRLIRTFPTLGTRISLLITHRIHVCFFTYIYHKHQPNLGRYTIHGSYGLYTVILFFDFFLYFLSV